MKKNPKQRGYSWYCQECDSSSEDDDEEEEETGTPNDTINNGNAVPVNGK